MFRTCDYCTAPATHRVIDATDELVCQPCARSQTDGPLRDYVRPLVSLSKGRPVSLVKTYVSA